MSALIGTTKAVTDLDSSEKKRLLTLIDKYFDGIEPSNFHKDLDEKDYIILLYAPNKDTLHPCHPHCIKGFSTVKIAKPDSRHRIVFNGDTIIEQAYQGTTALPRAWAELAFRLKANAPGKTWYWLLISSGYKTYRFLPVFFKSFYPRHDAKTPKTIKALMDRFAYDRYGEDYDPKKGIVTFSHSEERLKKGVADVTDERLKNPHIRYFVEKNPGHAAGDELVCLTEIHEDNLSKMGRRMLMKKADHD